MKEVEIDENFEVRRCGRMRIACYVRVRLCAGMFGNAPNRNETIFLFRFGSVP